MRDTGVYSGVMRTTVEFDADTARVIEQLRRERGLGTSWTTLHLMFEQQAAEVLGIPFAEVTQIALIPIGYTKGTDFKPAGREPLDSVVAWNTWAF